MPASRKLQASDATDLLADADRMLACKGKKVNEFNVAGGVTDDAVHAMLGPTGNMRSPTIKYGRTLVVGYNEEVFTDIFA